MLNERQGECPVEDGVLQGLFCLNGGTSHKFSFKHCVSKGRQLNLKTFFKYLKSVQHSKHNYLTPHQLPWWDCCTCVENAFFFLHNTENNSKRQFLMVVVEKTWRLVEEASVDLVHKQMIRIWYGCPPLAERSSRMVSLDSKLTQSVCPLPALIPPGALGKLNVSYYWLRYVNI